MRVPGSGSRSEAQLLCTRDSVSPKRENVLWQNGRNFAASSLDSRRHTAGAGSFSRTHTADLQFPHFQPKSRSRSDAAW